MKKAYIKPTMQAYDITKSQILCASTPSGDIPLGARDFGFGFDFEQDLQNGVPTLF